MIPDDLYTWLLKYFVYQVAGEEVLLDLEDKLMDEIWKHHDGDPQFPYFELEQFGYGIVDQFLADIYPSSPRKLKKPRIGVLGFLSFEFFTKRVTNFEIIPINTLSFIKDFNV